MPRNGRNGGADAGPPVERSGGFEVFARDPANKIGLLAAALQNGGSATVSGLAGGSAFLVSSAVAGYLKAELLYITNSEKRRDAAKRAFRSLGADSRALCLTLAEAAQKTVSPSFLESASLRLETGDRADRDETVAQLRRMGYKTREFVRLAGEMSVRGAIVDVFGAGADSPARVEFSGSEIRSVRLFDPRTQMSVERAGNVKIPPARMDDEERNSSVFDRRGESVVFLETGGAGMAHEPSPQRLSAEEITQKLAQTKTVRVLSLSPGDIDFNTSPVPLSGGIAEAARTLQSRGYGLKVFAGNGSEEGRLRHIFKEHNVRGADICAGTAGGGFVFPEIGTAFIDARDFAEKIPAEETAADKRFPPSAFESAFGEIKNGDLVVHREFGVGIFRGLKNISVRGRRGDFVECEYHGGDSVYVPASKIGLLHRYVGSEDDKPVIDRLGGPAWRKTVRGAKRATETVAGELLELYASRKSGGGHSFSKPGAEFREFEMGFMFEETPDQKKAIDEVTGDMEAPRPMDRLICGDTGFGKTEVALRAALKAVMDGFQVAFLVPTTLLVSQHLQTARARLASLPVNTVALSRFNSPGEEKRILGEIERGYADIVVGTHKILSGKVRFKNLGLLIIDEEHKFGVRQKERLKTMRENLDVLSLSATPIPRTLQLSLAGIRDISSINSPPRGRLPVKIRISKWNAGLIREIVLREKKRGGGVFFIHNRIETIGAVAERLREIIPEVSMEVAHGRLGKKDLEDRVGRFAGGKIDMLITTAIVESGLDIAGANTIFINDAHNFGIADLYQLKGRVGRGSLQAYACLLVPERKELSEDALRRLRRFAELWDFGGGYELAFSDLRMRGVGNLFGVEQSGHVARVGVEFYLEMLREATERLKTGKTAEKIEPEIRTDLQARIPDDYVESGRERLVFYKRISSSSAGDEVRALAGEVEDRFGPPPAQVKNLFALAALKTVMREHSVGFMDIREDGAEAFDSKDRAETKARFRKQGKAWKPFAVRGMPKGAAEAAAQMLSELRAV